MNFNLNSGYGQAYGLSNSGKVFVLAATTDSNHSTLSQIFTPDPDGVVILYSTFAAAIAAAKAGRNDKILVSQEFTTAPTLAELALMDTKGVRAEQMGGRMGDHYVTSRASATLPATTATPYFIVTGKVRIIDIIGEVTSVVQTQACNTKLIANPTVGADVDMCGVLSITAAEVGSIFTITGTLANAMVKTVSGVGVAQAAPLIVSAGTINLSTAATNTGATKWTVRWEPIDQGAAVIAA